MSRPWQLASGVSVVFTTLAFGHIMFHNTMHMLHGQANHLFIVLHTIVASAVGVLSLIGAYSLLTSRGRQDSH